MTSSRPGPNLSRIATSLGVSIATVSNALSGKGRVSGQLVERIREHAAELGYVPSQAGRALRTGRSGVIGLVLPDIANPLFPKIAQAIEFAASAAGYGVLIADSRGDAATQVEAINRLVERGVDGMVVIPRRATRISSVACPVAVIDTPSTPGNTVSADHWQGGREIAVHLAGLGHQRILIIGNNRESSVQNDRAGGIRAGLRPAMQAETLWIDELERDGGSGCPLGLAERVKQGFTAFAALSDLQALRALTELQQAGINVPADVSVTGFDDLIWSPVVTPSLTTVRMDMDRIAGIAVSALADTIGKSSAREGMLVTAEIERVAMQLIVRQSSGPCEPGIKNLRDGEHVR
ncbi:LacI family transcriptional regulator [Rhizobium lentis]|uniref:LacI family transcriptional regulator n=1 Tax=Rhizobium lentis TaxID=1138194 RepID=A0A7W9CWK3_9HYPH|nr:LacI family DNA-binding transcriptional regulator [Rhizobium lentis]MBB4575651.1 LacI family transcriptional regulator [Rhizobium lentis]MBB5551961.1 LacI family transcriptional regulator [Rhizobium lentis]MBB5562499.1 LacI family transcriptional regulator [Rhizobium lentis]MBB5568790.1 LacI family transcriptional regulator [Rhizobium lentis]